MRIRALVLAIPLIVLAACSSGTDTSATGSGTDASGSTSEAATLGPTVPPATAIAAPVAAEQLPTVTGDFGTKPTMTFPAGDPVGSLQRVVLSEGTGPVVAEGDWVVVNYLGQIWGGEVFDNSFDKGKTLAFQASPEGQVVPGWRIGMIGVPVGSRIMLTLPPADGYGAAGSSGAGIGGTDTLVFIVDIVQAIGPNTGGQTDAVPAAPLPATGPQVAGDLGAPATVTIPAGTPEPTAPTVTVIATGTGAPVVLGSVLVQYTATAWTGETAGTTWPSTDPNAAAAGTAGTGPQELPVATGGPFAGLVGIPVGSRVLVQVPGQASSQTGQPSPAIAAVVDILNQNTAT
ncbi:MAG: FKBP-type peptidyl-prolyl cis-trans isomerase [Nakamurella sp.]